MPTLRLSQRKPRMLSCRHNFDACRGHLRLALSVSSLGEACCTSSSQAADFETARAPARPKARIQCLFRTQASSRSRIFETWERRKVTWMQLPSTLHSATFAFADLRDHLWRSKILLMVRESTVISNRSEAANTASSSFMLGRSLNSERMY